MRRRQRGTGEAGIPSCADGERRLRTLELEVLEHCTLNCVHCPFLSHRHHLPAPLRFGACITLLDDFKALGGERLLVSGGEPLLRRDVSTIVGTAVDGGLEVVLRTSGCLPSSPASSPSQRGLSPPHPRLLRELLSAGLRTLLVRFLGSRPETHDRLARSAGSFDCALETVRRALDAGFRVEATLPLSRPMLAEAGEAVHLLLSVGVRRVNLSRLPPLQRDLGHRSRRSGLLVECSPKAAAVALREAMEAAGTKRESHLAPAPSLSPLLAWQRSLPRRGQDLPSHFCEACSAGWSSCTVDVRGEARPCRAFRWLRGFEMEALPPPPRGSTLRRAWEKGTERRWRSLRGEERHLPRACRICSSLPICDGGCPAQRIGAWGRADFAPDPWCPFLPGRFPSRVERENFRLPTLRR